jgi:hypothetical protein
MSFLRTLAVILVAAILLVAGLSRLPVSAQHGFIGLEFAPLTRAAFARTHQLAPHGALIAWIYPLGPADDAGLKAGEIVTKIDGVVVESAEQAADFVDAHKPGDRIELTVLDIASEDAKPKTIALVFLPGRPASTKIYTVRPPRTLAREGDFGPSMAANASWSARIARGAVTPFPLQRFGGSTCSAFAPEGWRVARARPDGSEFVLVSAGGHVKAIYLRLPQPNAATLVLIGNEIAANFGMQPQLGSPRALDHGYYVLPFGTLNNYAGFALYRMSAGVLSLRIAGVPATEVEGLEPLAGAVVLSIDCRDDKAVAFDARRPTELPPTAVSAHCIANDHCDEADYAGAYNDHLHTGYVHSGDGETFLIDPRKDIWAMGPNGSGTYRQIGGTVEKLEPGRTN